MLYPSLEAFEPSDLRAVGAELREAQSFVDTLMLFDQAEKSGGHFTSPLPDSMVIGRAALSRGH
jgi:hypothetical protein